MKIYAGNLSFDVTEEELRQEFAAFGEVESVNIITDKYSGRSKGFAFVESKLDSFIIRHEFVTEDKYNEILEYNKILRDWSVNLDYINN